MKNAILLVMMAFVAGRLIGQDATLILNLTNYDGEIVPKGAVVQLYQNGVPIAVGYSNEKGQAIVTCLSAGEYDVSVTSLSETKKMNSLELIEGNTTKSMIFGTDCCVWEIYYKPDLSNFSPYGDTKSVIRESILNSLFTYKYLKND